jgi:hypothetical protein
MKNFLWILGFALFFKSCISDTENNQTQLAHSIDSILESQEVIAERNTSSQTHSSKLDSSEFGDDPFYLSHLNEHVEYLPVDCSQTFDPENVLNTNTLFSHLQCPMDRKKTTRLLRQTLIAAKYHFTRTHDSLQHISNKDLLQMIATVYHQDIPSTILESNDKTFNESIERLRVLLRERQSKSRIYKFINDSIFNYRWMRFSITKVTNGILQLDYNGGGMAGSAEKQYYVLQDSNYSKINLEDILKKVDRILTKAVNEEAIANIGRFPVRFKSDINNKTYELEIMVDTYSSASCCPPYVARCKTKDFRTIIPGTLAYATTEHLDNPSIKPKWKTIR